ncbi:MAG: phenylacetate-CoA oxygenase subunit PaaC [Chitinophagales bacterium]|nr:phenylacetate-CoA oxygenase subunit PaaC [Chitinophagales bacterium]
MQSVKELILKMADDALIIGHRNSEWTGIGPILEEDIALSSMAQDKVGHALALYTILHDEFGEAVPDQFAFGRKEKDFRCCHLVEYPIGEYDFTAVRHFLFDHAEILRYELLTQSTFEPLALLAKKIKGELKYHVMHADSWITRLGLGNDESHSRMQSALNNAYPIALGIFEEGQFENELLEQKFFGGEKVLREMWEEKIEPIIGRAHLELPKAKDETIGMGGRNGYHTLHLQPLLDEMNEVISSEATGTEW